MTIPEAITLSVKYFSIAIAVIGVAWAFAWMVTKY